MKLIYLDEAGNTGRKADSDQPIHLIGCLIIDSAVAHSVEREIRAESKRIFGQQADSPEFELHGYDIYGGRNAFERVDPDIRIKLVRNLFAKISDFNISIGYAAVDKIKSITDRHPHDLAFQFICERIQDYLQSNGYYGLIFADQNSEMDRKLVRNLNYYKVHGTKWGWRPTVVDRIVGSLNTVPSHQNWLIQLADVVTHFLLRGLRINSEYTAYLIECRQTNEPRLKMNEWLMRHSSPGKRAAYELYQALDSRYIFQKLFPE